MEAGERQVLHWGVVAWVVKSDNPGMSRHHAYRTSDMISGNQSGPVVRRPLLAAVALLCIAASANAHVVLLAPNGGEILQSGSTYMIRWQILVQHNTQGWDLWYSVSGPNGPWVSIASNLPPGNTNMGAMQAYQWTVPFAPSTTVRVRVRQNNARVSYNDVSDSDLTINTPSASYAPFGQGCPGSAGVPTLGAQAGTLPVIGTTFTAQLTTLPSASAGAFLVLGQGRTPATSLTALGLSGCMSFVTLDASVFIPVSNGTGSWSVSIPNRMTLLGLNVFQQAVVLDPGAANPARAVVTNAADLFVSDH